MQPTCPKCGRANYFDVTVVGSGVFIVWCKGCGHIVGTA